ncbi:hypothetical protein QWY22_15075 [Planococcus liqunii]|uniref:hypothetical protein n=1 Tax=Planococcus liqunii TaxID=3058394 RepID=UPI00260CC3F0|nr:hypothetical protein [Planococcus sp. N056]WKA50211.1 hypothetical protein QWY22_15075 [Planococcus sp. N056]
MESKFETNKIAPVALIFFNRPHTLEKVFNEIKIARPSKLFLIQDGAREDNINDKKNIEKCLEIVEDIDWECEVYKNYSEKNLGCGVRPFTGIDWVFSKVDRAIILEDDCIPSQSFFYFCSELLEKYLNDNRIFLITGMNMELETTDCRDSYFYGFSGTNWGWASWRRCWSNMDYNLDFVKDNEVLKKLSMKLERDSGKKGLKEIEIFKKTNALIKEGKNISYWDVQWQATRYLNNQLSIIPAKNLITNIGVGEGATHAPTYVSKKRKKKEDLQFFFNDRYEITFPLKHPKYMIQNIEYDKKVDAKLHPHILKRGKNKVLNFLSKK